MTLSELIAGYPKVKYYLGDIVVRLRSVKPKTSGIDKNSNPYSFQHFIVYDNTLAVHSSWRPQWDMQTIPAGKKLVVSDITLKDYNGHTDIYMCNVDLFRDNSQESILKNFGVRNEAMGAAVSVATSNSFLSKSLNLDTIFQITNLFYDYLIDGVYPVWIERRLALTKEAVDLMVRLHYEPFEFQTIVDSIIHSADLTQVETIVVGLRRKLADTPKE